MVFLTPLMPGRGAMIQVTASIAGCLNAWMDWNGDGVLTDAGEQIATNLEMAAGANILTINLVPATTGVVYNRFRFTVRCGQGGQAPTGPASSGEVEDYALAALGDYVWNDQNKDGIQDLGELGIAGAEVTLTITWPGGGTTVVKTTTAADGSYCFGNLLLDEDQNGLGTYGPEPTFAIMVATPAGYPDASPAGVGDNSAVDSGLAAGEAVTTIQGSVNDTYDYGFWSNAPTAVTLRTLQAAPQSSWEAVLELLRLLAQPAAR